MCLPIIQSLSFDNTSYSPGATITASVAYTACCSGPFTAVGIDTGGLTWTVSFTGTGLTQLQATAGSTAGTFTFTATVTSEDGLADSQSWPFTVSSSGGGGGTAGLVGGTCNPKVYGMQPAQGFAAAQKMDSFLPAAVNPAETRQKLFWSNEGSFAPTDPELLNLLNNGVKVQISVKPTRTTNGSTISSQQAALTSAINSVLAVSANIEINLWQEPTSNDFPTSGGIVTYPQYWADYAPTIQATGAKCIFDPGTNGGVYAFNAANFSLLSPVPDAFYCDYYFDAFMNNARLDQPSGQPRSASSYMALADGAGIPFGLGEFGFNNKSGAPTTDEIAMWGSPVPWIDSTGGQHSISYIGYLIQVFQGRIAAGKTNADICGFFSGAQAPNGDIYGSFLASGDFKSGIYTQTIDAISGGKSTMTILGLKQMWNAGI